MTQVWAVIIGGAILQNGLSDKLPSSFGAHFDNNGAGIAYSVVPQIPSLPEPLKDEVRAAFAEALATLWIVLIAVAAVGMVVSLPMRGLPLHTQTDWRWALKDDDPGQHGDSAPSDILTTSMTDADKL